MAQLPADCRRHVVEAGQGFPAKLCCSKEDNGPLYWDLMYLHDDWKNHGYKESSYKFCREVAAADFDANPDQLHLRGKTPRCGCLLCSLMCRCAFSRFVLQHLPLSTCYAFARQGSLDGNCCGTEMFLKYCATVASKARSADKEKFALSFLANVVHWIPRVAYHTNGFTIDCEGLELQISAGGMITNFLEVVKAKHECMFQAWTSQWAAMKEMRILHDDMQDSAPFMEVVSFLLLAPKARRQQCRRPWSSRMVGTFLDLMAKRIIETLAQVTHIYFWQIYSVAVPVNDAAPLPSRQLRPMLSKYGLLSSCCPPIYLFKCFRHFGRVRVVKGFKFRGQLNSHTFSCLVAVLKCGCAGVEVARM